MWGVVASVAGSLLSGAMSSDSASNAADKQAESSAAAIAEQRRQYDQARADNAPFRNTGVAANTRLAYLLGLGGSGGGPYDPTKHMSNSELLNWWNNPSGPGLQDALGQGWDPVTKSGETAEQWLARGAPSLNAMDPIAERAYLGLPTTASGAGGNSDFGSLTRRFSLSDLNADPVYTTGLQFGKQQGEDAINSRALAGGSYDSGATLKALTRFGNDYGTTKAEGAYNRFNTDNTNIYNRLAGVSGAGQTATNTITSAGTSAANNISNLTTDAGNARAAGIVGGANAWGGAMSGISGAFNNYQNNKTLMALINRGSSSGTGGDYMTQNGLYY